MSVSAPPRCSLFVPVPRSEQLALVKKELHLWNAISVEQVNLLPLSASIHLYPTLLLSFFCLFPHSLSLALLPQRYFLVPAAKHVSWSSGWGLTFSLNRSINKWAGLSLLVFTSAVLYMPANSNTSPHWPCEGTRSRYARNKQGAINCGTGAEIHHTREL